MAEVEDVGKIDRISGEADVVEADLARAVTQLPGSKRPWLVPVVIAAVALLSLSLSLPALDRETTLTMSLLITFVIVLTTFFQRLARRAWIKQAFANIGGHTTFRFDDYGFTSESSMRQHRLAWASLARVVETPQAFLVYTTPRTLLVVPKRAFREAEVAALIRWLPERVTPQALPRAGIFAGGAQRTLLLWVVLVVAFVAIRQFLDQGRPTGPQPQRGRENAAKLPTTRDGETSDIDSSP